MCKFISPSKRYPLIGFYVLISVVLVISGCNGLDLDTYWRSERYILAAVDRKEQMSLGFDQQNGTSLGLVGATVFSIGANDKYIVVKQHPYSINSDRYDPSVTNYFIVERTTSPNYEDRKKKVQGPLSKDEFDKLSTSLTLPSFTKSFKGIE
jgi:hypothetical protein